MSSFRAASAAHPRPPSWLAPLVAAVSLSCGPPAVPAETWITDLGAVPIEGAAGPAASGDVREAARRLVRGPLPRGSGPPDHRFELASKPEAAVVTGVGAVLTDAAGFLLFDIRERNPPAFRQAFHHLFAAEGTAALPLLAKPIGSRGFTATSGDYTYNDSPEADPARFSIRHDHQYLLPVLREAVAEAPSLHLLAVTATAPAWMHLSGNGSPPRLAPGREGAYAAYLARFLTSYRDEGLPMATLVLRRPGPNPGLVLNREAGDRLHEELARALTAADAPTAIVRERAAGGYRFTVDPRRDAPPGLEGAARLLADGFGRGFTGVILPHLVLDGEGGPRLPTAAGPPAAGAALLTVTDDEPPGILYRPRFHAAAHFSRAARPGSRYLATTRTSSGEAVRELRVSAFEQPDGNVALVLLHTGRAPLGVEFRHGQRRTRLELPPSCLVTTTW